MLPHKEPRADVRRNYRLYQEIGLIASLGVAFVAFTIPASPSDTVVQTTTDNEIIEVEDIEQTRIVEPPPPPPPAPPPPREVPDAAEIEDEVIEAIDLDLSAEIRVPVAPPAPVAPPPPPPSAPPVQAAPPPPPPPEPESREPEVFEVVEQQPELIGGLDGLRERIVYPPLALQAGVEGTVYVQFIVDETGRVIDPVVVRSPNDLLARAAVEAVLTCEFRPGQQRGRPVRVRFTMPVKFQLRD